MLSGILGRGLISDNSGGTCIRLAGKHYTVYSGKSLLDTDWSVIVNHTGQIRARLS